MGFVVTDKSTRIKAMNDRVRKSFMGGRIMLTCGVAALEDGPKARLLQAVRDFDKFDEGNDPHNEHDMGFLDFEGERYAFKFDYFDKRMEYGSDDPSDEMKTTRVLTIMKSSEY